MESNLVTPWVHISYSLWLRHSNSTTPRDTVFKAKYLRSPPPSSRWRPGQAGMSFITSSTTSMDRKFSIQKQYINENENERWQLSLSSFYTICTLLSLIPKWKESHHLQFCSKSSEEKKKDKSKKLKAYSFSFLWLSQQYVYSSSWASPVKCESKTLF